MRDLLVLKQTGTVQDYRTAFNQLVYKVRLYEGHVSETLLVTRFILGLKDELRIAVEMQIPPTVHTTSQFAMIQEAMLARSKATVHKFQKPFLLKPIGGKLDSAPKQQFAAGDVWKARQDSSRNIGVPMGCAIAVGRNILLALCVCSGTQ
jgi:hypothetical protein